MPRLKTSVRGFSLALVAACIFVGTTAAQKLQQVGKSAGSSLPHVDAAFYQERVVESNDEFDLVRLTSKIDRSIQAAVLDNTQRVVWRGKVPSEWIALAPKQARIVLVGKQWDEGFGATDGKTVYTRVTVQDFSGNVLYRITDTGPIGRVMLSQNGMLLLLASREMRVYDAKGSRLWTKAGDYSEAWFCGDGRYLSSSRHDLKTRVHTLEIMNSQTGAIIRELKCKPTQDLRLLGMRPEKNQAIMAEFGTGASQRWDVVVRDLRQWSPVASLRDVEGYPFSVAWSEGGTEYALLLHKAGELRVGVWNPIDKSFYTQSLGARQVDFAHDRIASGTAAQEYRVIVGDTVTQFRCSN